MYNMISKRMIKDSVLRSSASKSLLLNFNRMSINTKILDEKEKGDERIYFTKQDGMFYF